MPSGNILRQIIFMSFLAPRIFFLEQIKRLAKIVEKFPDYQQSV